MPENDSQEIAHYQELTAEQRAILDALKMGNTRRASAAYAGIATSTFYLWMKENRTFSDAVTHAEAIAEVGHVGVLAKSAISGDWRASLEWLKRRRRIEWGDTLDIRKLDDETLLRLLTLAEGGEEEGDTAPEIANAESGTDRDAEAE